MVDVIFKGATRPAMVLGIPLLPLVVVGLASVLLTIWVLQIVGFLGAVVTLASCAVVLLVMRLISKADDQKLNQMLLRLQSLPARRNARYWGAQSSAPIAYRRHL